MKLMSKNENETRKAAMNFAEILKGGEVILMYGDLGAGKTVFVKALAKALGVREVVKSPTFNLMKCYKIHLPPSPAPPRAGGEVLTLCHIDAYRLKNFKDLLDIGADEYLGKENVITVIEWAERLEHKNTKTQKHKNTKIKLAGKIIKVKMEYGKKDNERMIEIKKLRK